MLHLQELMETLRPLTTELLYSGLFVNDANLWYLVTVRICLIDVNNIIVFLFKEEFGSDSRLDPSLDVVSSQLPKV